MGNTFFDILDLLNDVPKSERLAGELKYFAFDLDPDFTELYLIDISDAHTGDPLYSEPHLLHTVKVILQVPNLYFKLTGDLANAVLRDSKGDIFRQLKTPQDQLEYLTDIFYPVGHRCLGVTDGNHENRIYERCGIDICSMLAKNLGVPYRSGGIMVKISFGRGNNRDRKQPYVYYDYSTHGYGGARTKSAKAVKAERLSAWVLADRYSVSHDHVANVAPDILLIPDDRTHIDKETGFKVGKVKAKRKMLVKTNAYLKWGGYSEAKGFPPVDLCTPVTRFAGSGEPRVNVAV